MADEYTPEEIANISRAYNDAIKSGTPITQEMANAMKDAQKGIKGYAQAQQDAMQKLSKGVADLTKSMYEGKQGMAAMNSGVDAVAGGLDLLINLIPGARLLKIGLTLLTKAVAGSVKAVNEQSDALFKSYQDLAKTGAGAAGGMRDVFDNMQKFGYGIEQLGDMTALIKENSKTLSSFGGTVLGGTKIFADSMSEIQRGDMGRQFQRMGYAVDDINKFGAGYIKQQQMLGRSQTDIQKNLAAGTAKYMMELDKLARITGDTREAQEAKIAEAQAEDAFAATMDELREQAAAGDLQAEAKMKKLDILSRTMTGEAKMDLIRSVGGDVAAAGRMLNVAPAAYQMLIDNTSTAGDVMKKFVEEEKSFNKANRSLYQLNAASDFGYKFAEGQDRIAKFGEKNLDQQMSQAEAEQKVTDQATKNAADVRISQQQARDSLQSFVNIGVSPATTALKTLGEVVSGVSSALPGSPGGTGAESMGGGGRGFFAWAKETLNGGSSGEKSALLDIIGKGESRGDYNALVYGKDGKKVPGQADLTNMTIAQVQQYQKNMIGQGHASTAVGKYQMIADTLAAQVEKSGLNANTVKFDKKTQDLLASQLIDQAGYGRLSKEQVLKNLSRIWASLPKDMTGRGTYDGFNGNKVGVRPQEVMMAIPGPGDKQTSAVPAGPATGTGDKQTSAVPAGPATGPGDKQTSAVPASPAAGPSDKYSSKMPSNPSASLPENSNSTSASEEDARINKEILNSILGLVEKTDEANRIRKDVADNTNKSAQNTQPA